MGEAKATAEQIAAWKQQFGKVFQTSLSDSEVIWRKLRRKEYVTVMDNNFGDATMSDYQRVCLRQETIVKMVSLWPENMEDVIESNAGLATTMADEIVLRSGFEETETKEL
jgi:hypothetical protein